MQFSDGFLGLVNLHTEYYARTWAHIRDGRDWKWENYENFKIG